MGISDLIADYVHDPKNEVAAQILDILTRTNIDRFSLDLRKTILQLVDHIGHTFPDLQARRDNFLNENIDQFLEPLLLLSIEKLGEIESDSEQENENLALIRLISSQMLLTRSYTNRALPSFIETIQYQKFKVSANEYADILIALLQITSPGTLKIMKGRLKEKLLRLVLIIPTSFHADFHIALEMKLCNEPSHPRTEYCEQLLAQLDARKKKSKQQQRHSTQQVPYHQKIRLSETDAMKELNTIRTELININETNDGKSMLETLFNISKRLSSLKRSAPTSVQTHIDETTVKVKQLQALVISPQLIDSNQRLETSTKEEIGRARRTSRLLDTL